MKKIVWEILLTMVLGLALVFFACNNPVGPDNGGTTISVTGVSLYKSSTVLLVSVTEQLFATISPADASNQNVIWSSSNEAVATVSSSGLVTGIADGTAVITVTTEDGGNNDTCNVTVTSTAVAVTGVSLNKASTSIPYGDKEQLLATISPADATNPNVTWFSSNEAVATVSSSGWVTAVNAGTADVTVTTEDGGFTDSCTVTVEGAYIAGQYESSGGGYIACYWRNGSKHDLPGENGITYSVEVDNGDVYASGCYGPEDVETACYWKNGARQDLDNVPVGTTGSLAFGLAVSGSDLYIAGLYTDAGDISHACYWKNGIRQDLPGTDGAAYGIFVSGTDVYVSGSYMDAAFVACYWLNGTKHDLVGSDAQAVGIVVDSGDVYISGMFDYDTQTPEVCYWKNGTKNDLPGDNGADGYWLTISGTKVYIAGNYDHFPDLAIPCYWKNSARVYLDLDGAAEGYAYGVDVSGSDVWVAGEVTSVADVERACYWLNGTQFLLPDDGVGSVAWCVKVY